MVVSHKAKAIFVHIQKCAGTSIEEALRRADPTGIEFPCGKRHMPAKDLRDVLDPEVWSSYYKFAFVRNPWERLVSWHQMCIQSGTNEFQVFVKENYQNFSDFIRDDYCQQLARTRVNQLTYVADDYENLLVDFVGRFEDLDADFNKLKLTDAVKLPRLNRSAHGAYRDFYTPQTRDIVAQRFARDIEYFGYKFG